MKFQQFITLTVTAIALGAISTHARAHNCGELSPLMNSLGEQYTQLTYSSDTKNKDINQESTNLIELIELIDQANLYSGHGTRVECFGENGRWEEDETIFTLTDIDQRENNKGSLMLSAFEESGKDLKRKVIELPSAQQWQKTSDNQYSTSTLFRLQNFSNSGSRAAEIALNIHTTDKAVVLTEVLYINGLKVDWVTWNLDS